MSTTSLVFCSLLALTMGFLVQQIMENLVNLTLTVLPFNIKTIK